jgi:hypothetical protein
LYRIPTILCHEVNIIQVLEHISRDRKLPFLVIGGHAVVASGYRRATDDLDIIVTKEHRQTWREIMESLSYRLFSDQPTFAQFRPSQPWEWPVDLMFVSQETFFKLSRDAIEAKVHDVKVRIPSPEHLIALKLHSLRYGPPRREAVDLTDIVEIIAANKIDIAADKFRGICEHYGTAELMRESSKTSENRNLKQPEQDWLDLPDPQGFVSQHYPVSAEMILRLSEERLPYITSLPGFYERRLADKVDVPFELI